MKSDTCFEPYELAIEPICQTCDINVQSGEMDVDDKRFELISIDDEKNKGPYHFNHFICFFESEKIYQKLIDEAQCDALCNEIADNFASLFNPNDYAKVSTDVINTNSKLKRPTRFMGNLEKLFEPVIDRNRDSIQTFIEEHVYPNKYIPDALIRRLEAALEAQAAALKSNIEAICEHLNHIHYDWVALEVRTSTEPKTLHNHVSGTTLYDKRETLATKIMKDMKASLKKVAELITIVKGILEEIYEFSRNFLPQLDSNVIIFQAGIRAFCEALEWIGDTLTEILSLTPEDNGRHFLGGRRAWKFGVWEEKKRICYFETAALERFSGKAYYEIDQKSAELEYYDWNKKKHFPVFSIGDNVQCGAITYCVCGIWVDLLENVMKKYGLSGIDPEGFPNSRQQNRNYWRIIGSNINYQFWHTKHPEEFFLDKNFSQKHNGFDLCVETVQNRIQSIKYENMPKSIDDIK